MFWLQFDWRYANAVCTSRATGRAILMRENSLPLPIGHLFIETVAENVSPFMGECSRDTLFAVHGNPSGIYERDVFFSKRVRRSSNKICLSPILRKAFTPIFFRENENLPIVRCREKRQTPFDFSTSHRLFGIGIDVRLCFDRNFSK